MPSYWKLCAKISGLVLFNSRIICPNRPFAHENLDQRQSLAPYPRMLRLNQKEMNFALTIVVSSHSG